jgi:hypothetical protein
VDTRTETVPAPAPETPIAFLERIGAGLVDVDGARYDGEEFQKALEVYCENPQQMTVAQVKLMTLIDPKLGATVRARQLGWVPPETDEERKAGTLPVKRAEFFELVERWMSPIFATHRYKSREAQTRLDALERRIKELEDRPALKYVGSHRENEPYQEGSLVTKAGSLWLATEPTSRIPGTELSGWRLIVKRGQA